jgi:hypothetical protein
MKRCWSYTGAASLCSARKSEISVFIILVQVRSLDK